MSADSNINSNLFEPVRHQLELFFSLQVEVVRFSFQARLLLSLPQHPTPTHTGQLNHKCPTVNPQTQPAHILTSSTPSVPKSAPETQSPHVPERVPLRMGLAGLLKGVKARSSIQACPGTIPPTCWHGVCGLPGRSCKYFLKS